MKNLSSIEREDMKNVIDIVLDKDSVLNLRSTAYMMGQRRSGDDLKQCGDYLNILNDVLSRKITPMSVKDTQGRYSAAMCDQLYDFVYFLCDANELKQLVIRNYIRKQKEPDTYKKNVMTDFEQVLYRAISAKEGPPRPRKPAPRV